MRNGLLESLFGLAHDASSITSMNRTDRLLAIVLELQRHGVQRAEDLAATFETSKRTIYRDVEALAESGVPVVSTPGQGYALIEGYFLPPVSFSSDEATMLLLGVDVMAQSFDAQYREAATSAAAKIEGVLSEQRRSEVRTMQASLRFIASHNSDSVVLDRLQMLRRAVVECRRVRFRYFARFAEYNGPAEFREADPHALTFAETNWYLVAQDHKRHAARRFRLDRMEALSVLSQTFVRPNAEAVKQEMRAERDNELTLVAQVLFDKKVARWVREARFWFARKYEDCAEGLRVTYAVRHEDELLPHLLQWGGQLTVLSPESLRQRMRSEAERMLKNYEP